MTPCTPDCASGRRAGRSQAGAVPLHPGLRVRKTRRALVGKQVGRGFTAVAQRVPRLADLVELNAGWLYKAAARRRASRLARRGAAFWPRTVRRWRTGCSGESRLAAFTAVAQQMPRLAGLDELNAGRRYKAAARRRASRLAEGALPFGPRTAWHDTTYIYRLRKEMEELWR